MHDPVVHDTVVEISGVAPSDGDRFAATSAGTSVQPPRSSCANDALVKKIITRLITAMSLAFKNCKFKRAYSCMHFLGCSV